MDKINYLESEKISKLLFKFSLPCVASLLIGAFYNIVDQIFVGNNIGYLGNAATGVVFPILIITMAFAWCYGDGVGAYLSLCLGRGEKDKIHRCVGMLITVTVITALALILILFVFEESLLSLVGATYDSYDKDGNFIAGSMEMAKQYYKIVIGALVPYMLSNALCSVIRVDGSPSYAMVISLIGAFVNIGLDALFIITFDWGIKGAAYATIVGQFVTFALIVYYLVAKTKTFKLTPSSFKFDWKAFSPALKFGISTFITEISIVVVSFVCNFMLKTYGALSPEVGYDPSIPISAISIESKVFTVVINIVVGVILGAQPIIGYNYGAKRYDRVRGTYKAVAIATLLTGIISTAIVEIFPDALVKMFGTSGSNPTLYLNFAKKTFRIFLSMITVTCYIKMSAIFFQAVGKPSYAMISSLIRDILLFLPLVFVLPFTLGLDGVLWASPVADLLSIIVLVVLTLKFFKELKTQENFAS